MRSILCVLLVLAGVCSSVQAQANWVVKKRANGVLYTYPNAAGFASDEVVFTGDNSIEINPSTTTPAGQSLHGQEWFISRSSNSLDIEQVQFNATGDSWEYRVTVGKGYKNLLNQSFTDEWSDDRRFSVLPGCNHLWSFNVSESAMLNWQVNEKTGEIVTDQTDAPIVRLRTGCAGDLGDVQVTEYIRADADRVVRHGPEKALYGSRIVVSREIGYIVASSVGITGPNWPDFPLLASIVNTGPYDILNVTTQGVTGTGDGCIYSEMTSQFGSIRRVDSSADIWGKYSAIVGSIDNFVADRNIGGQLGAPDATLEAGRGGVELRAGKYNTLTGATIAPGSMYISAEYDRPIYPPVRRSTARRGEDQARSGGQARRDRRRCARSDQVQGPARRRITLNRKLDDDRRRPARDGQRSTAWRQQADLGGRQPRRQRLDAELLRVHVARTGHH